MRQVKTGIVMVLAVFGLASSASAADQPSAAEIMEKVRLYQQSQEIRLTGRLRHKDTVIPFTLECSGGVIRYQLKNPPETLTVQLGERSSEVREGEHKADESDLRAPLRGTDVTLEDLSLRFLYWDRAVLDGEQTVLGTRPSWRLKLQSASKRSSSYAVVLLWVDKDSGAMVRAEAYDWDAKPAKRFEVRSIQRYQGGWLLKQMRIQNLQGQSRDKTPTYLEIQKPE